MPKRRRVRYPIDLINHHGEVIAPMIPDAMPGGRPRKAGKREIVEAILYFLRVDCAWRLLPHDFPPWLHDRRFARFRQLQDVGRDLQGG